MKIKSTHNEKIKHTVEDDTKIALLYERTSNMIMSVLYRNKKNKKNRSTERKFPSSEKHEVFDDLKQCRQFVVNSRINNKKNRATLRNA